MFQNFNEKIENYFKEYKDYFTGSDFPDLRYNLSEDCQVISPSASLLNYNKGAGLKDSRALLVVPSIFNSSEILFLNEDSSFMELLKNSRREIFLLERKKIEKAEYGLEDYVTEILDIIKILSRTYRKIDLIGHCIGGNLALAAGLSSPKEVKSLTLLTTPWDFSYLKHKIGLYKLFGLDRIIGDNSTVPSIYNRALFFLLFPEIFPRKFDKYFSMNEEKDKILFFKIEKWLASGLPIPSKAFFEIIDAAERDSFLRNEWKVGGMFINPSLLKIPVFLSYSKEDRLVPTSSAILPGLLPKVRSYEARGGHISYLVGKGVKDFFYEYELWLLSLLS